MTERIYYTDPACRSFDAVVTAVIEHEGAPALVLDRTAFYPTSGGQPFDTGRLGTTEVLNTTDDGERVLHVVRGPLNVGDAVRGEIDWPRRFDHMQQHTGQHVLSAAFDRLLDNRTMSFHMGGESSTIDLARELAPADVERCVDEANRVVWDDRPVTIRFASPEEAARLPLRKDPVREGPLRLIEIAEFDLSACGGTHVARTGDIGLFKIYSEGGVAAGIRRIEATTGSTALAIVERQLRELAQVAKQLRAQPGAVEKAVGALLEEKKALEKELGRLRSRLALGQGQDLAAQAVDVKGAKVLVATLDGADAKTLRETMDKLKDRLKSAAIVLGAVNDGKVALIAGVTADLTGKLKAGELVNYVAQQVGGKGGGRPDMAQAGGTEPAKLPVALQSVKSWVEQRV